MNRIPIFVIIAAIAASIAHAHPAAHPAGNHADPAIDTRAEHAALTPDMLLGTWNCIRNNIECTITVTRELGDATIKASSIDADSDVEGERVYYSRNPKNNTWLRTCFHADGSRTTFTQPDVAPPDTLTFEHAATNGVPVSRPATRVIIRRESEDLITFETQTASGHGTWTRGPVTIWKRTKPYTPDDDDSIVAIP